MARAWPTWPWFQHRLSKDCLVGAGGGNGTPAAPVLDVESGISQAMGDWSFGEETQTATRLAKAFAPWMRDAGMATVGRHVPDGAVAADSHLELPVDPRPLTDIEARDLAPLSELIDEDIASRIELLPVAKAGGRF